MENPQILRILSKDDLHLEELGIGVNGDKHTRTALFCIIPDSDKSYNFIVGILYTQLFQELYFQADFRNGGKLPIQVTLMMDEFANVALPDDFCSLLSTMRSRRISAIIIIQNLAQIKALFKDTWETITGNCDTLVKGSYIPCKAVRILREYTRYRYKLVSCRSSEKNRYQNALTVCNVALDSVVSDIFGKSSTSIIDYLLEQSGTTINHEEIASKLLRRLKSKEDAVIESVEGYQMTDAQKYRMRLVRAHMDYITAEINDVDKMIENMISSNPDFENAIQFLCTIPGVKRDSAITIISEIGTDMSQFSSSKRLCCWAGLTPGSNESAGKKKSVRITRAGVYLKPALVQCAHAAVKSDKSPYYKKKYEALVKRRGKKRAIIAIARMILTAIYQMLSTGEEWNPSNLYKIDMPVALVEKQKAKAIRQAKKLLQREGTLPPDKPLAS